MSKQGIILACIGHGIRVNENRCKIGLWTGLRYHSSEYLLCILCIMRRSHMNYLTYVRGSGILIVGADVLL